MRSICNGRTPQSVALCGHGGFIGEFDLSTGKQTRMLPEMFNGWVNTIVKVEGSDFVVGTQYDGLNVLDLTSGEVKRSLFDGMGIFGMAYLGNHQLLAGVFKEYYLVDTRIGHTHSVTKGESQIMSIQLLSNEHTLALSLEALGKVQMINYSSGNIEILASIESSSGAYNPNSLLQVLTPSDRSDNYAFVYRDGKDSNIISKFELNKEIAHQFK